MPHSQAQPPDSNITSPQGAELPIDIQAISHLAEGRRHYVAGQILEAEKSYRAALELQPELTGAMQHLAELLLEQRRSTEAITVAQNLLTANKANSAAYHILGSAYANLGQGVSALTAFRQAIALNPDHGAAHLRIGIILRKLQKWDEAVVHLQKAVDLRPQDAEAHIEFGVLLSDLSRHDEAQAAFAIACRLRPIEVRPAFNRATPDFTALMIWAPGKANTPVNYLTEQAPYECRMQTVVEGMDTTARHPQASGDVIVNLVADEDQAHTLLQAIVPFVDRFSAPIINHPLNILSTDRQSIATRLSGIPDCHVPRTLRRDHASLVNAITHGDLFGLPLPLLLRAAGTHGGDAFECATTTEEMVAFTTHHPADQYYLTEFVDYRSEDDYFRKYRLIFVDGDIFPYHLAIHDHWKIHHYRTKMSEHKWMQKEEERFLAQPETVFGPAHFAALRRIVEIVALDYFGIDCAIDRHGRLVIFEVNACMLVEPDDSSYAYKDSYNTAVKSAFTAMLERIAKGKHRKRPMS